MQFTDHEDGTTVLLLHTSTSALALTLFTANHRKAPLPAPRRLESVLSPGLCEICGLLFHFYLP